MIMVHCILFTKDRLTPLGQHPGVEKNNGCVSWEHWPGYGFRYVLPEVVISLACSSFLGCSLWKLLVHVEQYQPTNKLTRTQSLSLMNSFAHISLCTELKSATTHLPYAAAYIDMLAIMLPDVELSPLILTSTEH